MKNAKAIAIALRKETWKVSVFTVALFAGFFYFYFA